MWLPPATVVGLLDQSQETWRAGSSIQKEKGNSNMKRIFVLLFAVCLTLPLFGCDSGGGDAGGGGTTTTTEEEAGGEETASEEAGGEEAAESEEAAEE